MAINVQTLKNQIETAINQRTLDKKDTFKTIVKSLREKCKVLNKLYANDGKALCDIFKSLRQAGLNPQGEPSSFEPRGCFMADDMNHNLGFKEYEDGTLCLCVMSNNNTVLFLRVGDSIECGDYRGNNTFGRISDILKKRKGTNIYFGNPVGVKLNENLLRCLESKIDFFLNKFEMFRDTYLEYASKMTSILEK